MGSKKRILVYLKKSASTEGPIAAHFTQSVVDYFGFRGNEAHLSVEMEDDKLLFTDDETKPTVKLKRSPYCAIHHLTQYQTNTLSQKTANKGIACVAGIILHTGDNKILLTRRANHLKLFPSYWAPPAGHIEENETATFPPKLSYGLPAFHHIMFLMLARLKPSLTSEVIQKQICLDPEEVGASAWLDRHMVEAVTACKEDAQSQKVNENVQEELKAILVTQANGEMQTPSLLKIPSDVLDRPSDLASVGTTFALEEWLKMAKSARSIPHGTV